MDDTLSPKRIREMIRAIDKQEWKVMLRAHQIFIRNSSFGRWQILTVAGLPMALWEGGKNEGQINLSIVDLKDIDLKFATLTRAALVGVLAEKQSFRGVTLINSIMTDSFLDGADFSMGRLEDIDFSRSSMRGAKFNKANLTGADFENCDLSGADFTGAKLERATFTHAKLEGVIGFDHPIFDGDGTKELKQIFDNFEGWVLETQFQQFIHRHDEATLIGELCSILQTLPEKFGGDMYLWKPFVSVSATAYFEARDFLRLANAVALGAPDGKIVKEWGWTNLWDESDIPGRPHDLVRILQQKNDLGDDAFFSQFIADSESLPHPHNAGLRSALVEMRRLSVDDLDPDFLTECAKRYVEGGGGGNQQLVWPDDLWHQAISAFARDTTISAEVLLSLADKKSLHEIVELALRTEIDPFFPFFELVETLVKVGEAEARFKAWEGGSKTSKKCMRTNIPKQ